MGNKDSKVPDEGLEPVAAKKIKWSLGGKKKSSSGDNVAEEVTIEAASNVASLSPKSGKREPSHSNSVEEEDKSQRAVIERDQIDSRSSAGKKRLSGRPDAEKELSRTSDKASRTPSPRKSPNRDPSQPTNEENEESISAKPSSPSRRKSSADSVATPGRRSSTRPQLESDQDDRQGGSSVKKSVLTTSQPESPSTSPKRVPKHDQTLSESRGTGQETEELSPKRQLSVSFGPDTILNLVDDEKKVNAEDNSASLSPRRPSTSSPSSTRQQGRRPSTETLVEEPVRKLNSPSKESRGRSSVGGDSPMKNVNGEPLSKASLQTTENSPIRQPSSPPRESRRRESKSEGSAAQLRNDVESAEDLKKLAVVDKSPTARRASKPGLSENAALQPASSMASSVASTASRQSRRLENVSESSSQPISPSPSPPQPRSPSRRGSRREIETIEDAPEVAQENITKTTGSTSSSSPSRRRSLREDPPAEGQLSSQERNPMPPTAPSPSQRSKAINKSPGKDGNREEVKHSRRVPRDETQDSSIFSGEERIHKLGSEEESANMSSSGSLASSSKRSGVGGSESSSSPKSILKKVIGDSSQADDLKKSAAEYTDKKGGGGELSPPKTPLKSILRKSNSHSSEDGGMLQLPSPPSNSVDRAKELTATAPAMGSGAKDLRHTKQVLTKSKSSPLVTEDSFTSEDVADTLPEPPPSPHSRGILKTTKDKGASGDVAVKSPERRPSARSTSPPRRNSFDEAQSAFVNRHIKERKENSESATISASPSKATQAGTQLSRALSPGSKSGGPSSPRTRSLASNATSTQGKEKSLEQEEAVKRTDDVAHVRKSGVNLSEAKREPKYLAANAARATSQGGVNRSSSSSASGVAPIAEKHVVSSDDVDEEEVEIEGEADAAILLTASASPSKPSGATTKSISTTKSDPPAPASPKPAPGKEATGAISDRGDLIAKRTASQSSARSGLSTVSLPRSTLNLLEDGNLSDIDDSDVCDSDPDVVKGRSSQSMASEAPPPAAAAARPLVHNTSSRSVSEKREAELKKPAAPTRDATKKGQQLGSSVISSPSSSSSSSESEKELKPKVSKFKPKFQLSMAALSSKDLKAAQMEEEKQLKSQDSGESRSFEKQHDRKEATDKPEPRGTAGHGNVRSLSANRQPGKPVEESAKSKKVLSGSAKSETKISKPQKKGKDIDYSSSSSEESDRELKPKKSKFQPRFQHNVGSKVDIKAALEEAYPASAPSAAPLPPPPPSVSPTPVNTSKSLSPSGSSGSPVHATSPTFAPASDLSSSEDEEFKAKQQQKKKFLPRFTFSQEQAQKSLEEERTGDDALPPPPPAQKQSSAAAVNAKAENVAAKGLGDKKEPSLRKKLSLRFSLSSGNLLSPRKSEKNEGKAKSPPPKGTTSLDIEKSESPSKKEFASPLRTVKRSEKNDSPPKNQSKNSPSRSLHQPASRPPVHRYSEPPPTTTSPTSLLPPDPPPAQEGGKGGAMSRKAMSSGTLLGKTSQLGDDGSSESSGYDDLEDGEELGDWLEDDDYTETQPEVSSESEEEDDRELSPFLKQHKSLYMIMRQVQLFDNLSMSQQEQLLQALRPVKFRASDVIVKQGERGDRFYMISSGEAVVTKKVGDEEEERMITHLHPGHYFGELALIYDDPRTATVTAVTDVSCMYLTAEDFSRTGQVHLSLIMKQVPLLSQLDAREQDIILRMLRPSNFNNGDYICHQGEEGDKFYMITKGEVVITENQADGTEREITKVYEGHCFGELALIYNEPRVANVKAVGHVKCMFLTKNEFKKALSTEKFQQYIQKFSEERQKRRAARSEQRSGAQSNEQANKSFVAPRSLQLTKTSSAKETNKLVKQRLANGMRVVNKYVIKRDLGRGTFGRVVLGEDEEHSKLFAIKILNKSFGQHLFGRDGQVEAEMNREIAIMKKLDHPNVVKLYEVIDDPSALKLYLVMEYCEKGPLMNGKSMIDPYTEEKARKYFIDMIQGLRYLHFQRVVHRDIKPDNLLVSADDVVKLSDFGTARAVINEEFLTEVKGTPAFMAPELLDINAKYTGPAADVWSLGATLYMMVIGHPPWVADNEIVLADKVQHDELTFPENSIMDPHLRNLLQRMLTKAPERRITLGEVASHEWVTCEGTEPLSLLEFQPDDELKVTVLESAEAISELPQKVNLRGLQDRLVQVHEQLGEGNSPPRRLPDRLDRTNSMRRERNRSGSPTSLGSTNSMSDPVAETRRIISGWRQQRRVDFLNAHAISEKSRDYLLRHNRVVFAPNKTEVTEVVLSNAPDAEELEMKKLGSFKFSDSSLGSGVFYKDDSLPFEERKLSRKKDFMMITSEVMKGTDGEVQTRKVILQAKDEDFSFASGSAKRTSSQRSALRHRRGVPNSETDSEGWGPGSPVPLGSMGSRASLTGMPTDDEMDHSLRKTSSTRYSNSDLEIDGAISIDEDASDHVSRDQQDGDSDSDEDDSDYDNIEENVDIDETFDELISSPRMGGEVDDPELVDLEPSDCSYGDMKLSTSGDRVKSRRRTLSILCASAEAQGERSTMEDRTVAIPDLNGQQKLHPDVYGALAFFAVYDGHNGENISSYLQKRLHQCFAETLVSMAESKSPRANKVGKTSSEQHSNSSKSRLSELLVDLSPVISRACEIVENEILDMEHERQAEYVKSAEGRGLSAPVTFAGSTASFAIIHQLPEAASSPKKAGKQQGEKTEGTTYLYVGNVGDSRTIMSRSAVAEQLTIDHKPMLPSERTRIESAGGWVHNNRLNGVLAVSRSFGDVMHKEEPGQLIATPDISRRQVLPSDEFLVLGSDGVWDVFSCQHTVNFFTRKLKEHGDVSRAAKDLVAKALAQFSHDNVSVVTVCLHKL